MNILIIEDSVVEATLLTKTLQKVIEEPVEVRHADTLAKGVETLKDRKTKVDLIFLDLGLPDSPDWHHTYEAVSPYTEHLPVIVMTSNKSPEIIEELMQHGFQDYIVKGGRKHEAEALKETIFFARLRHKMVDKLAKTVKEKDQTVNWLSGGYSA